MKSARSEELTRQAIDCYERYVCPLEESHRSEFAAVSEDGRIMLASTLREAIAKGARSLGPGNFVFKIGELVVGARK